MAYVYKILGQAAPADTNNADIYTVGTGKSTIVSAIHVANLTGTAATCRIFTRIAGATASNANTLAYDVSVPANSIFSISEGITLAATDVITVRTGTANALSFQVFGSEAI